MSETEHGIGAAYYSNLPTPTSVLECLCGYQARGETWEEAGSDLDEHLEQGGMG